MNMVKTRFVSGFILLLLRSKIIVSNISSCLFSVILSKAKNTICLPPHPSKPCEVVETNTEPNTDPMTFTLQKFNHQEIFRNLPKRLVDLQRNIQSLF